MQGLFEIERHSIQHKARSNLVLRNPTRADGQAINELVERCPPLDENSAYCNFLQSTHFQSTSVIAEKHGEVVGFITGYRKPTHTTHLFIWQVAVAPEARGQGLAMTMLNTLLSRDELSDIDAIETTITKDNQGSWGLFKRFDKYHGSQGEVTVFLDKQQHFDGEHDTEYLFHIPLKKEDK